MVHERTHKPVATSRKSFDQPRFAGSVTESAAQLFDCRVQAVLKIHKGIFEPKPLAHLLTGDKFAGMFEQHREDAKGLLLKFDFAAALEKLTRTQIQGIQIESQDS